jgi:hypothetical protein
VGVFLILFFIPGWEVRVFCDRIIEINKKTMKKIFLLILNIAALAAIVAGVSFFVIGAKREDPRITKFLNLVPEKIKSIITPKPLIGNLTPARDLRGTWISSLKGKGIQSYGKFDTGPGTTQVYQEGDIELVIDSVSGNVASGTFQYINLCTWSRTTAPKIPPISVPKKCVNSGASPIQVRVSGSRLDFGSVSAGGVNATMQGNYTTDLISGTTTATVSPYGIIKGEIHLIRKKN